MEPSSLFVCLMGMGTVFFGLICLIVLTMIMGKLVGGHAAPAAAPVPVAAAPAAATEGNRQEIAAAVAAAIGGGWARKRTESTSTARPMRSSWRS